MRPPEYFFRFWSLSLPQKVKIFMANRENSYGADLLDNVAKSGYYNRLIATVGSSIYFLSAKIASKLLLFLNILLRNVLNVKVIFFQSIHYT